MASLAARVARLSQGDARQRQMRQGEEQQEREAAEAKRRWFYWPEALILQRWPGGPEKAEHHVISQIARVARETRVYPNQWRCIHHLLAGVHGPHGEETMDRLRWAMALLELRGQLWPDGRDRDAVDPETRTEDDWAWAVGHLLDWLSTIDEHPAWAYTGWPPDMMRELGPRLGHTPGKPIDEEKLAARVALAEEAVTFPTGHPLPPCPDCDEGDA